MVIQNSLVGINALSRRSFLLGVSSSAFAIACSSQVDSAYNAPIEELNYLRPGFADGFVTPSTLIVGASQRAPFFLYGSNGIPIVNQLPDVIPGELTFPSGANTLIALDKYGTGIPTPYFLLEFLTSEVGLHKLSVEINKETQSISFFVVDRSEVNLVQTGDEMRVAEIPTFNSRSGFNPLCTRFDPCPFHDITLEDALLNKRPTVLLISTPGFCQSSICGPSLELLITAVEEKPSKMNVLHAEVYTEPQKISETSNLQNLLSPVILEYGMDFEPSLVIADENGIVVSRLDYTFDKIELDNALSLIS